jgi:predicted GNAT family N-acyltransferase
VAVRLRDATWSGDITQLQAVRRAVFIEEQSVPETDEWDDADPVCHHILAVDANRDAVGTGRLEANGKIGRVAVLPQYRGTGVGTAIVRHLVDLAARRGLTQVYLYSQSYAVGFYERLGFRAEGPEFYEVGIPHRRMSLRFANRDGNKAGRHGNPKHPVER